VSLITRNKFLYWLLWFVAVSGTLYLAVRRYQLYMGVVPKGPNGVAGDFWTFLHAARLIAEGHSPYSFAKLVKGGGYVYSALIAVILLPFSHAGNGHVWQVWTACSIAAVILFGALVMAVEAPTLYSWRRPLLFGIMMLTAFQFMPTTSELTNGQSDTFVLVALAAAVFATEQGWTVAGGVLLGVGALIKTWPGSIALVMLRRDYPGRMRAFLGFLGALLVAPLMAVAIGGTSQLVDLLKVTVDARTQHLPNFSVWGAPKLLFSSSGIAKAVLVSTPLRAAVTALLAVWVLALLVMVLRWSDSTVLSFWNVAGCVVLLLPVSHFAYTMLLLPMLWIWVARWLRSPSMGGAVFVVTVLLSIWWLVTFNLTMEYASNTSSLHFAITFFANLVAVSTSIIGDHFFKMSNQVLSPRVAHAR
jgi:hypothetical protein